MLYHECINQIEKVCNIKLPWKYLKQKGKFRKMELQQSIGGGVSIDREKESV